jgi:hypothetical protein
MLQPIAGCQHSEPQALPVHQHPPTPLAQKGNVELPQLPHPQPSILLTQAYCFPTNPRHFPSILTPPQKILIKIDSIEEIIPEGALKKESA